MKFAIYETHTVCRRIIIEANSEDEARQNWADDFNCQVDPYYYADNDDYEIEEIEKIQDES